MTLSHTPITPSKWPKPILMWGIPPLLVLAQDTSEYAKIERFNARCEIACFGGLVFLTVALVAGTIAAVYL